MTTKKINHLVISSIVFIFVILLLIPSILATLNSYFKTSLIDKLEIMESLPQFTVTSQEKETRKIIPCFFPDGWFSNNGTKKAIFKHRLCLNLNNSEPDLKEVFVKMTILFFNDENKEDDTIRPFFNFQQFLQEKEYTTNDKPKLLLNKPIQEHDVRLEVELKEVINRKIIQIQSIYELVDKNGIPFAGGTQTVAEKIIQTA